ncbi:hypothetical protein VRY85_05960 [Achromobacter sp. F4_2707]|uniref:hypothetical protein n=1 Tax=Achromobacter sp. F4_2707 TaxID=3114286 RepID=UPI0039C68C13
MQTGIAFAAGCAFWLRWVCIDFVTGMAAAMHPDVQVDCASHAQPLVVDITASSHAAVSCGSGLVWLGASSDQGRRGGREQQQDKRGGTQATVTPCLHGWEHGTRAAPWRAVRARKRLSVLGKLGAIGAGPCSTTLEAA